MKLILIFLSLLMTQAACAPMGTILYNMGDSMEKGSKRSTTCFTSYAQGSAVTNCN